VREEVFVLTRQDRVTNHRRNVLILADPPLFGGHLHERLVVNIVDVADPREFAADKCFQVRQISSVKIDMMESNRSESEHAEGQTRSAAAVRRRSLA
jgi:hypothetical protein